MTCTECRGTGWYIGLNTREPCRTCRPVFYVAEEFVDDFEAALDVAGVYFERGERDRLRLAYAYRGPEAGAETGWHKGSDGYEWRYRFREDGYVEIESRLAMRSGTVARERRAELAVDWSDLRRAEWKGGDSPRLFSLSTPETATFQEIIDGGVIGQLQVENSALAPADPPPPNGHEWVRAVKKARDQ